MCASVRAWSAPTAGGPAGRVHRCEVGVSRQDRLGCAESLRLVAIRLQLADDLQLGLHRAEACEHAVDAVIERGAARDTFQDRELVARLEPRGDVLARKHPAVVVVGRDDRRLSLPGRDVVVDQDDLHPLLLGGLKRRYDRRTRRGDRDPFHSGRDHVLDRGDLTRVVGRALPLREHDRGAGSLLVELLCAVLQGEVEAHRELRDHPELHHRLRVRCAVRLCRCAAAPHGNQQGRCAHARRQRDS